MGTNSFFKMRGKHFVVIRVPAQPDSCNLWLGFLHELTRMDHEWARIHF